MSGLRPHNVVVKPDIASVEITREMVEAGVAEFLSFDGRFEDEVEAVERIYTAMLLRAGKRVPPVGFEPTCL